MPRSIGWSGRSCERTDWGRRTRSGTFGRERRGGISIIGTEKVEKVPPGPVPLEVDGRMRECTDGVVLFVYLTVVRWTFLDDLAQPSTMPSILQSRRAIRSGHLDRISFIRDELIPMLVIDS